MRHNKKFNHLGRTASHRDAMLSNMATSLIMHKRISTTTAKAKALKRYIEPLLTKAKMDTTHSRRVVFKELQSKEAVTELFREIAQKIANRPGGYTRILRTGFRQGDAAEMCIIELVDYNENMLKEKAAKKAAKKEAVSELKEDNKRKKNSEKIGAWVWLCCEHHVLGKDAVHNNYQKNKEINEKMQMYTLRLTIN